MTKTLNNFKYIKCPLCKSNKYKILYKSTLTTHDFDKDSIRNNLKNSLDDYTKHAQIVRCKKCTLVYTNPQEDLSALYLGYTEVEDLEYLKTEKYRKILLLEHLKEIEKFIKTGKILDVGCFAGYFLSLARDRGFEPYGIEPSKWAVRIAKKNGATILGSDIELTKLTQNYFDVITLWDVIEHLANPDKVMKIISKSLKKKGLLVMGTPDIDSLFSKILGSRCPFLIRMHIVLFSPKSLSLLLKNNGFRVIHISKYGRIFPISYILDHIQIKNKLWILVKKIINKLPLIPHLPIRVDFKDSFLVIAEKI